jgi:NAD(P)-dependent dehydrogenase (short-subunit alcohol dehydrogenase family)
VVPGVIDTDWFTAKGVDEREVAGLKKRFAESSALGAVASAEDIASAVVYVGVDATKMTGQFLVIDGGYLIGKSFR